MERLCKEEQFFFLPRARSENKMLSRRLRQKKKYFFIDRQKQVRLTCKRYDKSMHRQDLLSPWSINIIASGSYNQCAQGPFSHKSVRRNSGFIKNFLPHFFLPFCTHKNKTKLRLYSTRYVLVFNVLNARADKAWINKWRYFSQLFSFLLLLY